MEAGQAADTPSFPCFLGMALMVINYLCLPLANLAGDHPLWHGKPPVAFKAAIFLGPLSTHSHRAHSSARPTQLHAVPCIHRFPLFLEVTLNSLPLSGPSSCLSQWRRLQQMCPSPLRLFHCD